MKLIVFQNNPLLTIPIMAKQPHPKLRSGLAKDVRVCVTNYWEMVAIWKICQGDLNFVSQ